MSNPLLLGDPRLFANVDNLPERSTADLKKDRVKYQMQLINSLSFPLRIVGAVTGIAIDTIAKTHPIADKAIRKTGEFIHNLIPDFVQHGYKNFRTRKVEEYKEYGISAEDTNYYLDSLTELTITGLTMGAGCLVKGIGKKLLKVRHRTHVCSDQLRFNAAKASTGSPYEDIKLKNGNVRIRSYYGKNQDLTVYVVMLEANSPKSHWVGLEAMNKLQAMAIEKGAKTLNIEFFVGNQRLLGLMKKKYPTLSKFPAIEMEGVEIFNIPLKNPAELPSSPLISGKDYITLSALGMSLGYPSNVNSQQNSEDPHLILKHGCDDADISLQSLHPLKHISELVLSPDADDVSTIFQPKWKEEATILKPQEENGKQAPEELEKLLSGLGYKYDGDPAPLNRELGDFVHFVSNRKQENDFQLAPRNTGVEELDKKETEDKVLFEAWDTTVAAINAINNLHEQDGVDNDEETQESGEKSLSSIDKLDREIEKAEAIEVESEKLQGEFEVEDSDKMGNPNEIWKKSIEVAYALCEAIVQGIAGAEMDRQQLAQFKDSQRFRSRIHDQMTEQRERQKIGPSVIDLHSRHHGPGAYFTRLHEIAKEYKADVEMLRSRLKENQQMQQTADQQIDDIAKFDQKTQELYRKAIEKRQKLGASLRTVSLFIKTAGMVVACIPGMQVAGAGISMAGSTLGQFSSTLTQKAVFTIARKAHQIGDKNLSTAQNLHQTAGELTSEASSVMQAQRGMREFNRVEGHFLQAPEAHQSSLNKDIADIQEEAARIAAQEKQKLEAIADESQKIADAKAAKGKLTKKRHKDKKAAKEAEIKSREAKILQMQKDLKTLETQKQSNHSELTATERTLRKAQYLGGLRGIEHQILNSQNPDVNETPEEREFREGVEEAIFQAQRNSALYEQTWQPYDAMARDTHDTLANLIGIMGQGKWKQRSEKALNFGAEMGTLGRLALKVKNDIYPNMSTFMNDHGKDVMLLWGAGTLSGPAAAAVLGLFVYQVFIPSIRGIVQIYKSYSSLKDISSGEPKPLTGIEKGLSDLLNNVSEVRQLLEHQTSVTDRNTFNKVVAIHTNLTLIGDQLKHEVEAGIKAILQKMDVAKYDQFTNEIDKMALNIKLFSKEKANEADLAAKPDRFVRIQEYLRYVAGVLESVTDRVYSGFSKGHSHVYNRRQVYPQVDLGLLYRDPRYFTGLLGNCLELHKEQPDVKKGMANWRLLSATADALIDYFRFINTSSDRAGRPDLIVKLQHQKEAIGNICRKIKGHINGIEDFYQVLTSVTRSLIQSRDNVWMKLHSNTQRMRLLKSLYMKAKQNSGIDQFADHITQNRNSLEFAGSKKFYLYQEFVDNSFLSNISSLDFVTIYDEMKAGSAFLANTQRVCEFVFCSLASGALTMGLTTVGLLVAVTAQNYREGLSFRHFDLNCVPDKLQQKQAEISAIFPLSLQNLKRNNPSGVTFNEVEESKLTKREHLLFDLKDRKITQVSSKNVLPIAAVEIDVGKKVTTDYFHDPKIGIQFSAEGIATAEEVEKIPETGIVQRSAEEYDTAVNTLISQYCQFLANVNSGQKIKAENPFCTIEKYQMVRGVSENLVPLALPKELIQECEKKINAHQELDDLEATETGTLVPAFYDFVLEESAIVLYFQFISEDNLKMQNGKDFCHITIAKFDPATLGAFQKDLTEKNMQINTTEFIIQAVYTSFGSDLGLPGKGTLKLQRSNLVAPHEVSFPGLFDLWKFSPESMIYYRSSEFSEAASLNLHKAMYGDDYLDGATERLFQPLQVDLGDHYIPVMKKVSEKRKGFNKKVEEFNNSFALFIALTKLLAKVDNKKLHGLIHNYFDIAPRFLSYNDELIQPSISYNDEKPLVEVDEALIDLFVSELRETPSSIVMKLRRQAESIAKIESWVTETAHESTVLMLPKTEKTLKLIGPSLQSVVNVVPLPNIGNSCYINASVQALFASKFRNCVKLLGNAVEDNQLKPLMRHLTYLEKFMAEKHSPGIRESLITLRNSLFEVGDDRNSDFSGSITEQKDAGVFIAAMLESSGYKMSMVERRSGLDILNNSQVSSSHTQIHNILFIPILKSVAKFQDLVHAYFNEAAKAADGVWKPENDGKACEVPESTIVRRITGELPEILVFQMLRYTNNPEFNQNLPQSPGNLPYLKVDKILEMPESGVIDMRRYMELNEKASISTQYRLVSIVEHHGKDSLGGHNTAYVREGERWFYVNDDLFLNEVKAEKVRMAEHYICMFERC